MSSPCCPPGSRPSAQSRVRGFGALDPALLADLFFIALIAHDRRTLGRVHAATVVSTLLVVGGHWATYPIKDSVWRNRHAPTLASFHTIAPTPPENGR